MQTTNRNDLDESLKEGEEYVKDIVSDTQKTLKQGREQLKQAIAEVDKRLHENPWPIVAGVAVGCTLLGFIMGSNKKS